MPEHMHIDTPAAGDWKADVEGFLVTSDTYHLVVTADVPTPANPLPTISARGPYRFNDGERISSVLVSEAQRAQLAAGALAIVRQGDSVELIPRKAADHVHARAPELILLDHGRKEGEPLPAADDEDDFYKQFVVPDDLMW